MQQLKRIIVYCSETFFRYFVSLCIFAENLKQIMDEQEYIEAHDEKFETILAKCKELFFEFGIRSLSMDDISRKLGISKKTLYNYVSNKEELLRHILDRDNNHSLLNCCIEGKKLNAIDILFEVSIRVSEEMQRISPMLKFELEKYYSELVMSHLQKKQQMIMELMQQNMKSGIAEGLFRKEISIDLIAALYVATLSELHKPEICKTFDITFEQIFEVMFENHIRAIATPEGLNYFETRKQAIFNTSHQI